MLREIVCDKFVENGKVRPPIEFHKGLNVILGNELGANSIGKSTFLLVIDFVFGGNDYVKKATDVGNNIGEHTIFFAFEFNNCKYYFSRSTQKFQVVDEYNKGYKEKRREIPLDEYNKWLMEQYKITQEELTFRALVSRFFRVYQRGNLNEKQPLYGGFNEKSSEAIIALEKIFNKYTVLRDAQQALNEAREKKKTFADAQAENYIPSVNSYKEYKKYESRRNQLVVEQESFSDVDALQNKTRDEIQNIYELKSRLQGLRCQQTRLGSKISQISAQLGGAVPEFQNDFCELEKFFNNINLRKIEEIEQFHKKLSKILHSELEEELNRAIEEQKTIDDLIASAEQELQDFDIPTGISKKLLREYSAKCQQINEINTQLANYNKFSQLKNDIKEYKQRHDELSKTVLAEIEKKINTQMREYNDFIYDGLKEPPVLELTSNNYYFKTINDSGTGNSFKSLIIFDLSILSLTNLPAIVHESLIFRTIGDEPFAKIIELYTKFPEKQVFIAIDKATSYHSIQTQETLEKNTVLRLSSGGFCLFGWSWNETTNNDGIR